MADELNLKSEIRLAQKLVIRLQSFIDKATVADAARKLRNPLPRISKEQWEDAVGSSPQTLGRIVDKVMRRLSIDPTNRRTIAKRCVVYLSHAVKAGQVVKEGNQGKQTYRRA